MVRVYRLGQREKKNAKGVHTNKDVSYVNVIVCNTINIVNSIRSSAEDRFGRETSAYFAFCLYICFLHTYI